MDNRSHYSIGVAARLSAVPVETVRIWQRRYALPAPQRSAGGHRLYSDDDVALLKAARVLVERGWRPADVFRLGARGVLQAAASSSSAPPTDFRRDIDAIVDAAVAFDDSRTAALLDGPLVQHAISDVATGLWLPLLARTGELWERGVVSVAVEHWVSQQVSSRVQAALRSSPTSSSSSSKVLCACVPDERHEVGLLTSALVLQRAGFPVVVLGGDLPAAELEESAQRVRPALLLLSATATLSKPASTTLPPALSRSPLSALPLLLGGQNAAALGGLLDRPHTVVASVTDVVAAAEAALGS